MPRFTRHVFVCCNRREPGNPRGCCDADGGEALRNQFKIELKKRGLNGQARANKAGCLDQCEHGPNVVIYPDGIWYGGVTLADVPRIIEQTIVGGVILEDLLIRDECLNNPHCPHVEAAKAKVQSPESRVEGQKDEARRAKAS
jgi:(2Fe-2S) ferredoxin